MKDELVDKLVTAVESAVSDALLRDPKVQELMKQAEVAGSKVSSISVIPKVFEKIESLDEQSLADANKVLQGLIGEIGGTEINSTDEKFLQSLKINPT
jgi:pantoate kinase